MVKYFRAVRNKLLNNSRMPSMLLRGATVATWKIVVWLGLVWFGLVRLHLETLVSFS
jgi:hypothetical protein